MKADAIYGTESLPLTFMDGICDRYETACKAAGIRGDLPSPEPFLEEVPDELRSRLLRQLTKLEFSYRQRRIKLAKTLRSLSKTLAPLKIVDLIGQGGMAKVYKAEDEQGQVVAVKVLPSRFSGDQVYRDRFEREAEVLAKIKHDNIIALHPIRRSDGGSSSYMDRRGSRIYFVMDYATGGSLRARIREGGIIPTDAINIILQICQGLQHAHKSDVIHRDIKPENILIDHQGQMKLADFGLAKVLGSAQTRTGEGMGTPGYMAPEQDQAAGAVGRTADIYSLGVVFYELLTGKRPTGEQLPDHLPWTSQVDKWLRNIVMCAIASNPDKRFQNVGELIAAIHRGPQPELPTERTETIVPKEEKPNPFVPGAKVESRWKRRSNYYRGTVTAISGTRVYVNYDDGDKEWTTAEMIRLQDGTPFVTVGLAVEARWKGGAKYYRGRVTDIDGKRVQMSYDDGDKEWTTTDLIRLVESPHQYTLGTVVLCRWKGGQRYFQGTLTGIDGERIHVNYEDGDKEWTTPDLVRLAERPHQIALGTVVLCRWRGGKGFFQGKVTAVDGDRIHIEYDDGEKEWTTADMVKK